MNQLKNNPMKAIDNPYKDFETISHYARKQLFKYEHPNNNQVQNKGRLDYLDKENCLLTVKK